MQCERIRYVSLLQVAHYKAAHFFYKGQSLQFNFGIVSSIIDISNATLSSELYFDIFLDISPYFDHIAELTSVEYSSNNTKTTITHFKVPTETSCNASITTQYGESMVHFMDGQIEDWMGHSVKNVSSHVDHVLVTYRLATHEVNFRCQCADQAYTCSSTWRYLSKNS